jgi:hypothetical protein
MRTAFAALLALLMIPCLGMAGEPLTWTLQATSVKNVLPELSKRTGLSLSASPQTENEIICLHVTDVSPDLLLDQIATAVNGEWKKEAGGMRLVRTAIQVRDEERAHFQSDVNTIRKALEREQKLIGNGKMTQDSAEALADKAAAVVRTYNPSSPGNFYRRWRDIQSQLPAHRWIAIVLKSFTAEQLAAIHPWRKVVFSNRPTASQFPLASVNAATLRQIASEMELWEEAKRKKDLKAPTVNGMTYWIEGIEPTSQEEDAEPGIPVRAVLCISRYGFEPDLQIEFTLLDASGKRVTSVNSSLGRDWESVVRPETEAKPGEPVLEPNEVLSQILKAARAMGQSPGMPPALRQQLLTPTKNEPLALLASPILIQYAEKKQVNFVAALADTDLLGMFDDKPVPVSQFENMARALHPEFEIKDGWLLLKLANPVIARKYRVDRRALESYLQRATSNTVFSLEEQAAFACTLPRSDCNFLPQQLRQLLADPSDRAYFDENLLRFYGLLSTAQRNQAKAGGIPIASLTAAQKEAVNDLVYGPYSNVDLRTNEQGEIPPGYSYETFYEGVGREPTECLPHGIDPSGVVKIKETVDDVAFTLPTQRAQWVEQGRAMSPSELAWEMYASSNPDKFPWMRDSDQVHDLSKLKYGSRRNLEIELDLSVAIKIAQTMQTNHLNSDYAAYDTLPADFRKKVAEELENLKKSYENANVTSESEGESTVGSP